MSTRMENFKYVVRRWVQSLNLRDAMRTEDINDFTFANEEIDAKAKNNEKNVGDVAGCPTIQKAKERNDPNGDRVVGLLSDVAAQRVLLKVTDLLNFVKCCAVAVFCRMMRHNLVKDTNNKCRAGILPEQEWTKRLGNILRYLTTPHPIRSYDTVPLTLINSNLFEND